MDARPARRLPIAIRLTPMEIFHALRMETDTPEGTPPSAGPQARQYYIEDSDNDKNDAGADGYKPSSKA